MKNFLIDYTVYMRMLATQHRRIRHTADTPHFFRGELQEFFEGLRSRVEFPCLITESSEVEYTGTRQNLAKRRTTSFIVADSYENVGDFSEMEEKMSGCEMIAEELLGRMLTDTDKPFHSVDIEGIEGQYLANEAQRYVGYRVNLTLVEPGVCTYNKEVWDEES